MVTRAELCHALVGIPEDLGWGGEYNTDEIGALEDRAWQAHHRFFTQQLFSKDNVVGDILELADIDPDHHIHGALWYNDLETRYLGQDLGAELGVGLKLCTSVVVEGLVGLVKDIFQSSLDQ